MNLVPRAWQAKTHVVMSEVVVRVQNGPDGQPGAIPAKLFTPEAGNGAGIVLVQEIFGLTRYLQQRAADLADEGWTVLVPNLYWRIGASVVDEDSEQALPAAMELMQANPWDETVSDIRACVATMRHWPETGRRVAVMGFCYGGGLAYAAASASTREDADAASTPDALVSYYGSALPQLVDQVEPVQVPSLHHFGEADQYIGFGEVLRIREAVSHGADVEFCSYPGAGHAFDNPSPLFHHKLSSEDAWHNTLLWLYEHFPAEGR